MSHALAGLQVFVGYDAARLQQLIADHQVDAVIIGNGLSRGNPELEWFWSRKPCAYYSLPQFLQEHVLRGRTVIAACGTHGKTTTTTLAAYLLQHSGQQPGWLIGGVPQDLPCGAHFGAASAPFVIEGDEYDSAFFDKRAKFISYTPTIAILNNLEIDHLDIYRDIEDLKRSFNHLLRTVPAHGLVIGNADDANIRSLLPVSWAHALWVSAEDHPFAQLHIRDFTESSSGSSFSLYYQGQLLGQVSWSLSGLFNVRNAAMAALSAAAAQYLLAHPSASSASVWQNFQPQLDLSCLSSFRGVLRRQQVRFSSPSLTVIEDFAHHPTAVQVTLQALRGRFPGHRFVVCLEPRSGTTRTHAHQHTFPAALAVADDVLLAPVYGGDKLPADRRLDTSRLAADIRALGRQALALASCHDIPAQLPSVDASSSQPTVVVFCTNGSFQGAMDSYLHRLTPAPLHA